MSAPLPIDRAIDTNLSWRAQLDREFESALGRLQTSYNRFVRAAQPLLAQLNTDITDGYEVTGAIRAEEIRGLPSFRRLLNMVERELSDYAVLARNLSGDVSDQAVVTGTDNAAQMIAVAAGRFEAQARQIVQRPAPEMVRDAVQFLDSDTMRGKWDTFGANAAQQFSDVVLGSIDKGARPRTIDRVASTWLTVPYVWSTTTIRTAQLSGFRHAGNLTYRENPRILIGWFWVSALNNRTCVSCWKKHGELHLLNETLNDHHNGQCWPFPAWYGSEDTITSGPEIFALLPEEEQREIFNNNLLYQAWRDGSITWDDLSTSYTDEVYGELWRPPTAKSLGL